MGRRLGGGRRAKSVGVDVFVGERGKERELECKDRTGERREF